MESNITKIPCIILQNVLENMCGYKTLKERLIRLNISKFKVLKTIF